MGDFDVMDGALAGAAGVTLHGIVLVPILVIAAVAAVAWLVFRIGTAIVAFIRDLRPVASAEDELGYIAGQRAEAICDLLDLHRQTLARMDQIAREGTVEGHGREVQR
jgi:hypothetical protein